jgi:hypothetical protein
MGGLATIDLLQANRSELLDDVLVRLCNILQLSPTQFSLAESHYHAICDWLGQEDSELNQFDPDLYPQGSVALGTTVKPQVGEEYDVDLVCELNVDYRRVPKPVLLLDLIEKRMRQSERYRDRLERKKRCLRVNYEHDFHLDILPACPDSGAGSTCLVVPDREDVRWRASNPKGFVNWFKHQSALKPSVSFAQKAMDSAAPLPQPQSAEQKNTLQLSVQLFKRWRDRHYADTPDLAPVSIVLTTLMGDHYYGEQSVSSNLAVSVQAILDSLPASGRLIVVNPSHPQEELSERWKEPANYLAFMSGLKVFKKKLTDLANTEDMGRQSALLQDMFGDSVTKAAFAEQGGSIQKVRDAQSMGITRAAGGIVSLSSIASTPVPRNTFYGDL